MKRVIILFIGALFLSSCGVIRSKQFNSNATSSISRVSLYTNEGKVAPNVLWSQFDATKRGSLIAVLPEDSKINVRVLAENTPDMAVESVKDITGSINYEGVEISSAVKLTKNIAQIQRSSTTQSLLAISYKISEMLNNDGSINADAKYLYEELIKGAITTSDNDAKIAQAEADAVSASETTKVEQAKAEIEKYKSLQSIIEKTEGSLTKEEVQIFLEKL